MASLVLGQCAALCLSNLPELATGADDELEEHFEELKKTKDLESGRS